ncbi:anaerobic ribonucleoside-triphosphate reductase activating protein [Pedobacter nyackensis]|uniref:anaerobic ribonucleoside-triphosphate reductase activating protein n=1 Tax=Pedobacter nyackensis TaxID=475255 RepID=UPI00292E71A1|nr:anaerobic ribonucleoside-triphosphate reductase activating protein [Pedobacter nyackensis]
MKDQTPIYNITPFTLLDYPDKVACIIRLAGCNMRCVYCYNPEIVLGKGTINFEKVLEFLKLRKGILDGVVLSGGECTMHSKIIWLMKEIKAMGFLIKLDTNGSRPLMIEHLVNLKLPDYIALDFKALPDKFEAITGSDLFENFEHTLSFLIASGQKFEVRTTVHSDLIKENDLERMMRYLSLMKYKGTYYIQQFVNGVPTVGNVGHSISTFNMQDIVSELENAAHSRYHIDLVFR